MRCFVLLLLTTTAAFAQVRPNPGQGDPRLQTVQYDAQQVVQLQVSTGYQLMVAFSSGEVVETIAVGDSAAWQVTPGKRGDFIFVKNLQASGATNMTVVTDARTYSFELMPAGGYVSDQAYSVRFIYDELKPPATEWETSITASYQVRGSKHIRPKSVVQRGNQVVIEWLTDQPMPAVFSYEDGKEVVVNGEMQNDKFVITGKPSMLIFRLDKKLATAVRNTTKRQRQ